VLNDYTDFHGRDKETSLILLFVLLRFSLTLLNHTVCVSLYDLDLSSEGHLASKFRDFEFYFQGNEDLIIVHEALNFGDCHLSLAVRSNLL